MHPNEFNHVSGVFVFAYPYPFPKKLLLPVSRSPAPFFLIHECLLLLLSAFCVSRSLLPQKPVLAALTECGCV